MNASDGIVMTKMKSTFAMAPVWSNASITLTTIHDKSQSLNILPIYLLH